jgi:hypothetical protein
VFLVEVWRLTSGQPAFRASARDVESSERQWFDDLESLTRFLASSAKHDSQATRADDGETRREAPRS